MKNTPWGSTYRAPPTILHGNAPYFRLSISLHHLVSKGQRSWDVLKSVQDDLSSSHMLIAHAVRK